MYAERDAWVPNFKESERQFSAQSLRLWPKEAWCCMPPRSSQTSFQSWSNRASFIMHDCLHWAAKLLLCFASELDWDPFYGAPCFADNSDIVRSLSETYKAAESMRNDLAVGGIEVQPRDSSVFIPPCDTHAEPPAMLAGASCNVFLWPGDLWVGNWEQVLSATWMSLWLGSVQENDAASEEIYTWSVLLGLLL